MARLGSLYNKTFKEYFDGIQQFFKRRFLYIFQIKSINQKLPYNLSFLPTLANVFKWINKMVSTAVSFVIFETTF